MKPNESPIRVGTARCAVRGTERSVRWRNVAPDWFDSLRCLTLRSATGTSQRNVPTALVALAVLLCCHATAQTTKPPATPTIIYVADFELDAAYLKTDPAAPPAPPKAPGLLGKALPPPPGAKKDPQDLARELVDSMSAAIIKDLTQAGLTARRLRTGEPFPTSGWLARGAFINVNQGSQLERAVVGFGKGKTELQVLVDIAELAQGTLMNQLNEVKVAASSGKTPGSAPMIEGHPAVVATRFVMAGNNLNKNVKQTAAKIAEEVAERTGLPQ